jgi:hypothetical protein
MMSIAPVVPPELVGCLSAAELTVFVQLRLHADRWEAATDLAAADAT